jgi:hypothetical protein
MTRPLSFWEVDVNLREAVYRKLKDHEAYMSAALGSGSAKDYNEYQRMVGKIEGAIMLYQDIENLLKENDEADADAA